MIGSYLTNLANLTNIFATQFSFSISIWAIAVAVILYIASSFFMRRFWPDMNRGRINLYSLALALLAGIIVSFAV